MISKISMSSVLACVLLSFPAYAEMPSFYKNPLVIDSSHPIFDDTHNYQNQLQQQQIKSQQITEPEELKLVQIETEELEIVQEEPEQQQSQNWYYQQQDWQQWEQQEQLPELPTQEEQIQQQQEQFQQMQQQLQQSQQQLEQRFQNLPSPSSIEQFQQNRPNIPFSN
jgi:DNA anti-recombination protein RmuC